MASLKLSLVFLGVVQISRQRVSQAKTQHAHEQDKMIITYVYDIAEFILPKIV